MTDNGDDTSGTDNTNAFGQTALLAKRLSAAMEEFSQSVVLCDADDKIIF